MIRFLGVQFPRVRCLVSRGGHRKAPAPLSALPASLSAAWAVGGTQEEAFSAVCKPDFPQPPGQRQRKEKYAKSVLHPKLAISGRGRRAEATSDQSRAKRLHYANSYRGFPRPASPHCVRRVHCGSAPFLLHRARCIFFSVRRLESPQRPSEAVSVGSGGARERVQFSPLAETETSGLCDGAMGVHSVRQSGTSPVPPPGGGVLSSPRRARIPSFRVGRGFPVRPAGVASSPPAGARTPLLAWTGPLPPAQQSITPRPAAEKGGAFPLGI